MAEQNPFKIGSTFPEIGGQEEEVEQILDKSGLENMPYEGKSLYMPHPEPGSSNTSQGEAPVLENPDLVKDNPSVSSTDKKKRNPRKLRSNIHLQETECKQELQKSQENREQKDQKRLWLLIEENMQLRAENCQLTVKTEDLNLQVKACQKVISEMQQKEENLKSELLEKTWQIKQLKEKNMKTDEKEKILSFELQQAKKELKLMRQQNKQLQEGWKHRDHKMLSNTSGDQNITGKERKKKQREFKRKKVDKKNLEGIRQKWEEKNRRLQLKLQKLEKKIEKKQKDKNTEDLSKFHKKIEQERNQFSEEKTVLEKRFIYIKQRSKILKKENKNLKERYINLVNYITCKICWESYVRVAFFPCRHLNCCENCANKVSECPECRKEIEDKLQLYF